MDESTGTWGNRIRRRAVLKGMSAVGGTAAMGLLPRLASADVDRSYVDACGTLVGVPGPVLEPVNQPGKLAGGFRMLTEAAMLAGPEAMEEWLGTYRQATERGDTNDEIAQILYHTAPALSRLGIKLWLFGMWTGASEHDALDDITYEGKSVKDTFVYSAVAYRRGWIWRIAQAHPMGYSHFDLNSWGEEPPMLADYIGYNIG